MEIEQGLYRNQHKLEIKKDLWYKRRSLYVLSIIIFICNIAISLMTQSIIHLIITVCSLIGIYGIYNYHNCQSCFFGVVLVLQFIHGIILSIICETSADLLSFIIIIVIFDVLVFYLLYEFIRELKKLTNYDIYDLVTDRSQIIQMPTELIQIQI